MTCRSSIDGISLGEKLSTLSTKDFEQIKENNNDNLNATTKCFLKAISTSCRAMGHTEQAAKDARRRCFAMLEYFRLNSLFLSTTPDDKCSFRVRLYCKPQYWVRPTIYSKMEFIVFFHVFTTWNACCPVIHFPSCCLINIVQNGISCFLSQVYPAILT
jgi:hypothetical protein